MIRRGQVDLSSRCHALNNLFAKILLTTELALEESAQRCVKANLEAIVSLAQVGGELVENLRSVALEADGERSG